MARKKATKSTAKKRQSPRPKTTKNLPPGLAAHWRKKGVPSK